MLAVLATALTALPAGAAPSGGNGISVPSQLEDLKLDTPVTGSVSVDVLTTEGSVEVSVGLSEAPVALGGSAAAIAAEQAEFAAALAAIAPSAVVTGSADTVLNRVFVELDVADVAAVAEIASVSSIREVGEYELDLTDTVPYIGGTAVQGSGFDGSGVTVAVLDSGLDFTHANLGGPGTLEAYEECYGVSPFDGSWSPSEPHNAAPVGDCANYLGDGAPKVIAGFDFVGELWPFGPRTEDPNPIDFEGHGTHVGDIIAGVNGVAPGASLVGVKVCSAVSSSCNGVALIKGMDFAVNAEVDVINMSLGSVYGQPFDDDLSQAVDNATAVGVLTVASAGNSADKPYVTGSPAAAPTALSVAQTQVPSAVEIPMEIIEPASAAGLYEAVFQPWSEPQTAAISGEVIFPAGDNQEGCDPFEPGQFDGEIVAVDRGACNFSQKIQNIEAAGGILGIIITVNGAAPFPGGFGGGELPGIPAYMIFDTDGDPLRAGGAVVNFDPANGTPLVGTMVGSSSRGPSLQGNTIKPEIGAPGASISAEVGTGTGETPFGGTSGAAPMVSGSAALLLDAEPDLIPAEVKARLINTGETEIYTAPGTDLAPIARIGGGEVRVDRAVASDGAAWDADALNGALNFGFVDASGVATATKTITVANYGTSDITYSITPTFRYANDAALGAVTPSAPASVTVPAGSTTEFELEVEIDGAALPAWGMNSGGNGANADVMTLQEIDGYLILDAEGDDNDIHMPWMVVPRKSADIDVEQVRKNATLTNNGVGTASLEVYDLLATSEDLPPSIQGAQMPIIDLAAVGVAVFPVPAGFCSGQESAVISFAVNTHERQTHANAPALFEFDLDVDGDGVADYAVYNADLSLLSGTFDLSDGRNVVYAEDLATGAVSVFFFTDHETNSANTVLNVCAEQIGIDGLNDVKKRQLGVTLAVDLYFTGDVTDFTLINLGAGLEQPAVRVGNTPTFGFELDPGASETVRLFSNSAGEQGALILIRGGAPDGEEAIILQP